MAEPNWTDLLWGLVRTFAPAEAEARVVAMNPQAQALIDAVRTGATMPGTQEQDPMMTGRFDPQRKAIYRNVLQAAEDRPETAYVGMTKRMPPGYEEASGAYNPDIEAIALREFDPFYSKSKRYSAVVPTAENYQEVLAHELTHFLLTKLRPELMTDPPGLPILMFGHPPGQHKFIEYLQGQSESPVTQGPTGQWQPDTAAYASLRPFQSEVSPYHRDIYAAALRRILQDPALLKQALQGLGRR